MNYIICPFNYGDHFQKGKIYFMTIENDRVMIHFNENDAGYHIGEKKDLVELNDFLRIYAFKNDKEAPYPFKVYDNIFKEIIKKMKGTILKEKEDL